MDYAALLSIALRALLRNKIQRMSGDFIMTDEEVQPIGELPHFHFTHFWSTGKAEDLAQAFRTALDAHAAVKNP